MSNVDDHLDRLRIRQLAQLRRATYRSRSYCIIAAVACAVGAVQLAIIAVRQLRSSGVHPPVIAYLLLAAGAALGCVWFIHRAVELHRQAARHNIPAPESPPDFAPLSDGSQIARNLEDVH